MLFVAKWHVHWNCIIHNHVFVYHLSSSLMHGHCNPGSVSAYKSEGHHHCTLLLFQPFYFFSTLKTTTSHHCRTVSCRYIFSTCHSTKIPHTDPGRGSNFLSKSVGKTQLTRVIITWSAWNFHRTSPNTFAHRITVISRSISNKFPPTFTGKFRRTSNTSARLEELARTEPKNNLQQRLGHEFSEAASDFLWYRGDKEG